MSKILKSYMKTFLKNWLSTFFIILFLATLSTAIIGILATPIQIYSKISKAEKDTIKYDSKIDLNKNQSVRYDFDFIEKYFYKDTKENPIESDVLKILNHLANIDEIIKPPEIGGFQQKEKDNIESRWNTMWNSYRNSSTGTLTFRATDFNKIFLSEGENKYDNLESFKKFQVQHHIKRAIFEAYLEMENLIKNDEVVTQEDQNSVFLGAFYKIYQFVKINKIKITLSRDSIIKIINTKDLQVHYNYSLKDNTWYEWETNEAQNPNIYLLNYTLIKQEASEILSNNKYQYDDRIYVLEKLINKAAEINKTDYEITANRSFALAPLQGIFGGKNTVDLRTEKSYKLNSSDQNASGLDRKYSNITSVLFDTKVSKNSKTTDKWDKINKPEIIISSAYAKANNIKLGDEIQLPNANTSVFGTMLNYINSGVIPNVQINTSDSFFSNNFSVKVVGIGQTLEDYVPGKSFSSFNQKQQNYAIIYANANFTEKYRNYEYKFLTSSEATATTSFKIKSSDASKSITSENLVLNYNQDDEIVVFKNSSNILKSWSQSSFDQTATNLKIRIIIFIVISAAILALAFIFITFNLKKEINETRKQLGIFKSSGYFTNELSWIFSFKTFILFFTSILIGFFCSLPFQQFAAKGFENTLTIYYAPMYFSWIMFFSIVVLVPAAFLLISFVLTLRDLNEKPLSLINNSKRKAPKVKNSFLVRLAQKKNIFFTWRLRRAFIKNSKGKFLVIQTLFAFSSLSYILIFGAQTISTKVINQGFSVYNDKIDHYYTWDKAFDSINIKDEETKYNWANSNLKPLNLDYIDNSQYTNTNQYLLEKSNVGDVEYRFKVSALMQMTINYYNTLDNEDKIKFILPESEMLYTLFNSFNINLEDFNEKENSNNLNFMNTLFNYDLNEASVVEAAKEVKKDGKTDKVINPLTVFPLIDQDKVTLKNIRADELTNFFYNEVIELFSSKIFQIVSLYQFLPELLNESNVFKSFDEFVKKIVNSKDVVFDYEKFTNSESVNKLVTVFDPKNNNFWHNSAKNKIFNHFTQIINGKKSFTDPQIVALFFNNSLNTLPLVLSSALMVSDASSDKIFDKMINVNSVFFDKRNESLSSNILFSMGDKINETFLKGYMVSNRFDKYGDFRNAFNFDGVTSGQMQEFINPLDDEYIPAIIPYFLHRDKNINAGDIIKINSTTSTTIEIPVKVVGVNKSQTISLGEDSIMLNKEKFEKLYFSEELQKTEIFTTLFSQNEMLDTEMSFTNIINSFLETVNKENNMAMSADSGSKIFLQIFHKLFNETKEYSLLNRIKEKIDLSNLSKEVIQVQAGSTKANVKARINDTLNDLADTVGLKIEKDYTITYSDDSFIDDNLQNKAKINVEATSTSKVFTGKVEDIKVIGETETLSVIKIRQRTKVITNPGLFSNYTNNSMPFNILKAAANFAIEIANKIMFVFVMLSTVILSIILLVVIGIVVDESKATILTMKALGYNSLKVNWTVIGSYLIGLVISFLLAFVVSIIIWQIVLYWVSIQFSVYIFLGIDFRSALITAPIILLVLLIGWYAADKQVRKLPLTQITNM